MQLHELVREPKCLKRTNCPGDERCTLTRIRAYSYPVLTWEAGQPQNDYAENTCLDVHRSLPVLYEHL